MNLRKTFALFFITSFLFVNNAQSATTQWKENQSQGAKTRLIASFYKDESGKDKLIAGLHFQIGKGWKIYGNSAGGIGIPPSFDFSGSQNYQNHELFWPKANEEQEEIGTEILKYTTYRDEIIIPIEVNFADFGKKTKLSLQVSYGLCKDVCIPANNSFLLEIPKEIDQKALSFIQDFYPKKIAKENPKKEDSKEKPAEEKPAMTSLPYAILLALIGGAILNIMPCVLPVLSIKLFSIIKNTNASKTRIRLAFFYTTCGIISCFLILAFFASIIKSTGTSLGWGFQFQNPYFLTSLIIILTLMAANLAGLFEITFDQFLVNVLNKKISASEETSQIKGKKNIFVPNFLSGILSVLLATPCSAPFLGSAISFALTQEVSIIFIIFLAIGAGFSIPYIILFIAPKLVYLMPKPGNWMNLVKRIMAIMLALTALWLMFILAGNIGVMQATLTGIISTLILICFEIRSRIPRIITFITLVIATFMLPMYLKESKPVTTKTDSRLLKEFDEKLLYQLVDQGKTILVDVTADWCVTCKLNKSVVLDNKEVVEKLNSRNIIIMRADITKPNKDVMMFLKKHQRFAIPFNAVYGPGAKNGLLTKEILTKKALFKIIDQASN